jgi:hypothetical protein
MQASNLKSSKYAPRTPAENLAISRAERLKKEKEQATRLLSRLQWKAESLRASYIRARDIVFAEIDQHGNIDRRGDTRYPFVLGVNCVSTLTCLGHRVETNLKKKQAESMFKVDFFEWYTLLERFLTVCLSTLGVSISGAGPRTNVNALRFITNSDFARNRTEASHQFHANLLEALDDAKNPLHPALGSQDVRIQLGLAKDYRNRWKDADEMAKPNQWLQAGDEERKPIKLDELELETMIRTILLGCEYALSIVHEKPSSPSTFSSHDFTSNGYHFNDSMETDDQPLEYMDDAMDLD